MNHREKIKELAENIRNIAGQIGMLTDEIPVLYDAENYDYQVKIGMAEVIIETFNADMEKIIGWFEYCLIARGVEIDPRVELLLEMLMRESLAQVGACDDGDEDEAPAVR